MSDSSLKFKLCGIQLPTDITLQIDVKLSTLFGNIILPLFSTFQPKFCLPVGLLVKARPLRGTQYMRKSSQS